LQFQLSWSTTRRRKGEGEGYLEELGADRVVHEGEASGQGEESPPEGAHTRHPGDGQQPGPASAELGHDGVHNASEAAVVSRRLGR